MYEVYREDGHVIYRSEDYAATKEMYDWFRTHVPCFTYRMRTITEIF